MVFAKEQIHTFMSEGDPTNFPQITRQGDDKKRGLHASVFNNSERHQYL